MRVRRIRFWLVVNRFGEIKPRKTYPHNLLPGEHAFPMVLNMPAWEPVIHTDDPIELTVPEYPDATLEEA